jgi:hypothetical protein
MLNPFSASTCKIPLLRQRETRINMAAKTPIPKSMIAEVCGGRLKCKEDSKNKRLAFFNPELFTITLPLLLDWLQCGHAAQGKTVCETFLLPAGHQKMASLPYQPALALQRTKQGAPGSTSAQASTRKRLEAEDRGAQAKRDLAGRRTLPASLGFVASVIISVVFATCFGLV